MGKMFDHTMALKLLDVYPDDMLTILGLGKDGYGIRFRKERQRANRILVQALNYILTNIIAYDKYYTAPYMGKHFFYLSMSAKSREEVAYILKKGNLYSGIDLLASRGVINQISCYCPMMPKGRRRYPVRVGQKYWRAMMAQMNAGFQYTMVNSFDTINERITHKELIDYLCTLNPTIERKRLSRAIIYGMSRIGRFTVMGHGVELHSGVLNFKFQTYVMKRASRKLTDRHIAIIKQNQKAKAEGTTTKYQRLLKFIRWQRTKISLKKAQS